MDGARMKQSSLLALGDFAVYGVLARLKRSHRKETRGANRTRRIDNP